MRASCRIGQIVCAFIHWEIVLVKKKKMCKYNLGLKKSLVNTRWLFAKIDPLLLDVL